MRRYRDIPGPTVPDDLTELQRAVYDALPEDRWVPTEDVQSAVAWHAGSVTRTLGVLAERGLVAEDSTYLRGEPVRLWWRLPKVIRYWSEKREYAPGASVALMPTEGRVEPPYPEPCAICQTLAHGTEEHPDTAELAAWQALPEFYDDLYAADGSEIVRAVVKALRDRGLLREDDG